MVTRCIARVPSCDCEVPLPRLRDRDDLFGLVRAIYHAAAVSFGSSIETRSLPISLAATHRGFTFYVAAPTSSIVPLNFGGCSSIPKLCE